MQYLRRPRCSVADKVPMCSSALDEATSGVSDMALSADDALVDVTDIVRRVVASRIGDRSTGEEIVQETLTRVLTARRRLDDAALVPYAVVTARNLVASHWRQLDTKRRHEHRLLVRDVSEQVEDQIVLREETDAIRAALERLSPDDRDVLIAHEVGRQNTQTIADDVGSTPRAVAAQLHRARAKLRVEYLLEMHGPPPSPRCHAMLRALSAGDQRRQRELDTGYHLLECDFCADLSGPLMDRRSKPHDEAHVRIRLDADIVTARQIGREFALRAGFSDTDCTVIATAISEISRNIVRFARRGEITLTLVSEDNDSGLLIVARDSGPGIVDIDQAMTVGYTTYGGQGLGLPGSRRLMDEFDITSEPGRGTTVTMTKWRRNGANATRNDRPR